jgi:aspartyl-tRNA synthetase
MRCTGVSCHALRSYDVHSSQVVLFANDTTVSKQMVKYTSQIPKESIVDIEGLITCPEKPIEACSQSDVSSVSHAGVALVLGVRSLAT